MKNDSRPIIYLITEKATPEQLADMARFYDGYIKVAVDCERGILVGGGEWHADCEELLLKNGSVQENVWGAGYDLNTHEVDFYSLINVRPRQENPDQNILSTERRAVVERIIRERLEP